MPELDGHEWGVVLCVFPSRGKDTSPVAPVPEGDCCGTILAIVRSGCPVVEGRVEEAVSPSATRIG